MKIKQPIKRGQQIDISSMITKQRAGNNESCRTNKHVNAFNTNKHVNAFNTSNNDISNIQCATDTVSHDSVSFAHAMSTVSTIVSCDGLNLTATLDKRDQSEFLGRLSKYSGHTNFKNAQKMKPYRHGRNICDGGQIIGQIRFDPFGDRAGYFFLHVNPAKLDAGQSQLIQGLVSYLLGESWCSFVGRARVSMFDAAVDVRGVNIASIIPVPSGATQSGFVMKFFHEGRTRQYKQCTEYVGHNTSEKNACIYDKAEERSEVVGVIGREDITRVEVQAKPRVRGRFAEEVSTLADLPAYKNPLLMLSIAEFQKDAEGDDLLKIASVLTAYIGSTAVLQLVADKLVQKRIKDHIGKLPCCWWTPDVYWREFLRGLATHPLFSDCRLLDEPAYVKFFAS